MEEMESLRAELEHYKAEKEKIRDIVGGIGGRASPRRRKAINSLFLILVIAAFAFEVLRLTLGWQIPYLPSVLVLEIAVLLVSIKIIWMIHMQSKVDHFQFYVLHSIEFQMNMLARRINDLSKAVSAIGSAPQRRDPESKPAP